MNEQTNKQEQMRVEQIVALFSALGRTHSTVLGLKLSAVDFTRGRLVINPNSHVFWLKSGHRVSVASIKTGGIIASVDKTVDENRPAPIFPDEQKEIEFLRTCARNIIEQAMVRKCVKPECETLVDLRKRRSGACCAQHMNYVCSHPDCVAKAKQKGWKHYTHPYGSKIAAAHIEYRIEV